MNMRVELTRKAVRQLERLGEPLKGRIVRALKKLGKEPPQEDIKKMEGRDGYRVRVGGHRVLFDIGLDAVYVYKIAPRGDAYKEG